MKGKIKIDENLCDGCGACVPSCAEGAIEIIDGKARLREDLCDGLGACLGTCPRGAITVMEEADDETRSLHLHTCPFEPPDMSGRRAAHSHLTNWPIQISLLPVESPVFKDASLTVSADCVPFAYGDFQTRFIQGRKICTGCPKLDDVRFYKDKLAKIIALNDIKEIEVAYMEVPCCTALARAIHEARGQAGKSIPLRLTRVGINGEILESKII